MALLWQKRTGGNLYQVRNAGRSLRLYTNGVLHTQYHPQQPFSGYVWDWLLLPVFFYPPQTIRRVLVLGVGGGAVFHTLRQFVNPECIVGVELDAVHVQIAQRFFGLNHHGFELHQGDAVHWLQHYAGEKFDLIIDDVFGGTNGEPLAVTAASRRWFSLLRRQLSAQGMVVKNFADAASWKRASQEQGLRQGFRSVLVLSGERDQNRVAVFTRREVKAATLREQIKQMPQLAAALAKRKTVFRVQTVGV